MNRTYFPDANETVRLEFGEFLIHPGNLVHGGVDITQGSRYLMIMFTHTESWEDEYEGTGEDGTELQWELG